MVGLCASELALFKCDDLVSTKGIDKGGRSFSEALKPCHLQMHLLCKAILELLVIFVLPMQVKFLDSWQTARLQEGLSEARASVKA